MTFQYGFLGSLVNCVLVDCLRSARRSSRMGITSSIRGLESPVRERPERREPKSSSCIKQISWRPGGTFGIASDPPRGCDRDRFLGVTIIVTKVRYDTFIICNNTKGQTPHAATTQSYWRIPQCQRCDTAVFVLWSRPYLRMSIHSHPYWK
jgi:hypothetical protein